MNQKGSRDREPVELARRSLMSGGVEESIDVDVSVQVAYDQWTQFESVPQFMGGVESITQIDEIRNHGVTRVGGVTREFDTEIFEQHLDERVAWTTVAGTPSTPAW